MRSGPDQRSRGRFNGNRPSQQHPRAPQNNQTFDSNGPDIRVRGNAYQLFERYLALAREAARTDDRVASENYYQHAEHYFRINNTNREQNSPEASRPINPASVETSAPPSGPSEIEVDSEQPLRRDADEVGG